MVRAIQRIVATPPTTDVSVVTFDQPFRESRHAGECDISAVLLYTSGVDLYLIRHAIAEERRLDLDDVDRELTDEGRGRFQAIVSALGDVGIRFDRIYHSPWTRAVQTGELLAPISHGPSISTEELATSPELDFFTKLDGNSVACVGHEPWMGEAVSLLAFGDARAAEIRMKKGGVAWLRGWPGDEVMELRGLWSPKILLR